MDQDWTPVVFKKNTTEKKHIHNREGNSNLKILDSNEPIAPLLVKLDTRRKIQTARLQKKLSQKDLALKINIPAKTINDYESGRAIFDKKILNKISKALSIKLC